jgi:hypothetical protein
MLSIVTGRLQTFPGDNRWYAALSPEHERSTWQTWFYAPWMPCVCSYPSFRFYMEEQLTAMEGLDLHKR